MTLHVILPNDVDDPGTPSGGNVYDRRLCTGLVAAGWPVREHAVRGAWPRPGDTERADLAGVLSAVPDGAPVLLDGLIASAVPEVLVPQAQRLRLAVLVHLPLDDEAEGAALAAARVIVTTSDWTRRRLLDRYPLPAGRVHVARPGVDPAPVAPASAAGGRLLCVAPVSRHKGHDLLVEALAKVADLPWACVCAGSLDRDPDFVALLRGQLDTDRLTDRVRLVGPRTGTDLDAAYAAADLLVLPSRGETYGMVVTEALARGVPVLATAVGGLTEALGRAPDGGRPGTLVPPDDPGALSGALRHWLTDAGLRHRLRRSALRRRTTLHGWSATAADVSTALEAL